MGKRGVAVHHPYGRRRCRRLHVGPEARRISQPHELRIVRDGQQLLDYLRHGANSQRPGTPWPDLILLDLKMPRKDGREALGELKADPRLQSILIVVLTTSTSRDDIGFCYRMGVNS